MFSLFREFSEEFFVFNVTSLTGELVFEDVLFIAPCPAGFVDISANACRPNKTA